MPPWVHQAQTSVKAYLTQTWKYLWKEWRKKTCTEGNVNVYLKTLM